MSRSVCVSRLIQLRVGIDIRIESAVDPALTVVLSHAFDHVPLDQPKMCGTKAQEEACIHTSRNSCLIVLVLWLLGVI